MMTTVASEKLAGLEKTLTGIENYLLRRKTERQDATIDGALDIVNKAADMGAIDFDGCDASGDDDGADSGETQDDDADAFDSGVDAGGDGED